MLAPLKDRSLIEREPPAEILIERLAADNRNLRSALRQSRREQKRQAAEFARSNVAQSNEISRLQTLLAAAQERIVQLEAGPAIIELGARLMELSEANTQLVEAARRAWTLDRTLCAARHECQRLACERDAALQRLDEQTREAAHFGL